MGQASPPLLLFLSELEHSWKPAAMAVGVMRNASPLHCRKSGLDMFNFLASKHRQPPQYNPNDEEEEEVQLKSARYITGGESYQAAAFCNSW